MSITLRRSQPSGATLTTLVRYVRLGQVLTGLEQPGLWRVDWAHACRDNGETVLSLYLVDDITNEAFELTLPLDAPLTLARQEDIRDRIRAHMMRPDFGQR